MPFGSPKPDQVLKTGDRKPAFKVALKYTDGAPVRLTGNTVQFSMRQKIAVNPITVAGAATVLEIDGLPDTYGLCEYPWAAGNTLTAGGYDAEFRVVYPDGTEQTVPTDPEDPYLYVLILPDRS